MADTIHPPFRVAFRVDASLAIGTGHVMRCLTLADALRAQGAQCVFICRPHAGNLLEQIDARGHAAVALPALSPSDSTSFAADPVHAAWLGVGWKRDAEETCRAIGEAVDWLVVDHYGLDRQWQSALRPACAHLMVMDDLADREHDCDLLLDPGLGRQVEDYAALVPSNAVLLLGPQYALLRPEFAQHRAESLARRAKPGLQHVLVTMGGVDRDNATGRVLEALSACPLPPDLRITVVMGSHAPWLNAVRAQAVEMSRPTRVLVGVNDMARLMTESDLAIGAAGSTSWERCCLGLPSLVLVLAENQSEAARALCALGAVVGIKTSDNLPETLATLLQTMSPNKLRGLSNRAAAVCEGQGTSVVANFLVRRVCAEMRAYE